MDGLDLLDIRSCSALHALTNFMKTPGRLTKHETEGVGQASTGFVLRYTSLREWEVNSVKGRSAMPSIATSRGSILSGRSHDIILHRVLLDILGPDAGESLVSKQDPYSNYR